MPCTAAHSWRWLTCAAGYALDSIYEEAREHFDEKEISDLTLAIAAINAWNRMTISFRLVPAVRNPRRKKGLGYRLDRPTNDC